MLEYLLTIKDTFFIGIRSENSSVIKIYRTILNRDMSNDPIHSYSPFESKNVIIATLIKSFSRFKLPNR